MPIQEAQQAPRVLGLLPANHQPEPSHPQLQKCLGLASHDVKPEDAIYATKTGRNMVFGLIKKSAPARAATFPFPHPPEHQMVGRVQIVDKQNPLNENLQQYAWQGRLAEVGALFPSKREAAEFGGCRSRCRLKTKKLGGPPQAASRTRRRS